MKNIVLIGFMGTGKTTAGQNLANILKRPFLDTDREVEKQCGMAIADMFKLHGEDFFRQQERLAIIEAIRHGAAVIATGGGAVLSAENVACMKSGGIVIALTASPEAILRRVGADSTRPLLHTEDKMQAINDLLRKRAHLYGIADYSVDTSDLSPLQVSDRILYLLQEGGHPVG